MYSWMLNPNLKKEEVERIIASRLQAHKEHLDHIEAGMKRIEDPVKREEYFRMQWAALQMWQMIG